MKYALLIYGDEKREAQLSEEEWNQVMADHRGFSERNERYIVGGEALEPTGTATSIRRKGGSHTVTDGPFAETREQFGGFYLIDCENLDEAIRIAKDLPISEHDVLEIRPVMVFES